MNVYKITAHNGPLRKHSGGEHVRMTCYCHAKNPQEVRRDYERMFPTSQWTIELIIPMNFRFFGQTTEVIG